MITFECDIDFGKDESECKRVNSCEFSVISHQQCAQLMRNKTEREEYQARYWVSFCLVSSFHSGAMRPALPVDVHHVPDSERRDAS